jgi:hypothetical protein
MMSSYGGYHGIFNVTRLCHSMISGIWSSSKRMRFPESNNLETVADVVRWWLLLNFHCDMLVPFQKTLTVIMAALHSLLGTFREF